MPSKLMTPLSVPVRPLDPVVAVAGEATAVDTAITTYAATATDALAPYAATALDAAVSTSAATALDALLPYAATALDVAITTYAATAVDALAG